MTFAEFARVVILFLAMLLLFVVGVDFLVRSPLISDYYGEMLGWLPLAELPFLAYLVLCLLCLLLPLIYVIVSRLSAKMQRGIEGRSPQGDVYYLKPESIEPVLAQNVKSRVSHVDRVKEVLITQPGAQPKVFMHVSVSGGADVPKIESEVRTEIRRTLQQLLGSDQAGIRVKFTAVPSGRGPRRPEKRRRTRRQPDAPDSLTIEA